MIDRLVANTSWTNLFLDSHVRHGAIAYSDHIPILLNMIGEFLPSYKGPKLFKFEAMWLGAQKCLDIVEECQGSVSKHTITKVVIDRIKTYGDDLHRWNKLEFGHVQTNLHMAQTDLQLLQLASPNSINHEQMKGAKNEMQKWLEKDEIM